MILALDTSHIKGSVAVTCGSEIICEILFDAGDTHSATLMPAVDNCIRTAKTTLADIDRFALVSGPGSFTGLRIGLATVKAFAAVHRRPVVPVTSLEVLAAAFPFARLPVLPLIDARKGEVYAGLYTAGKGLPEELVAPFSARPETIGDILREAGFGGPFILCGTGAGRYGELLSSAVQEGSCFGGHRWSFPAASILAVLSLGKEAVAYEELSVLEPFYIRPPDARLPGGSKLREGGGR